MGILAWFSTDIEATVIRIEAAVKALSKKVDNNMATANEVLTEVKDAVDAASAQLTKGVTEVTGKIEELLAHVAAGGEPDPELVAAVRASLSTLSGQVQVLDNVVPDANA